MPVQQMDQMIASARNRVWFYSVMVTEKVEWNTNCFFDVYQVNFIVSDSGAHVLNSWTQEDQNLQEVCAVFENYLNVIKLSKNNFF